MRPNSNSIQSHSSRIQLQIHSTQVTSIPHQFKQFPTQLSTIHFDSKSIQVISSKVQSNSIHFDSIQFNSVQFNPTQANPTRSISIISIQSNTGQFDSIECAPIRVKLIQCNSIEFLIQISCN